MNVSKVLLAALEVESELMADTALVQGKGRDVYWIVYLKTVGRLDSSSLVCSSARCSK